MTTIEIQLDQHTSPVVELMDPCPVVLYRHESASSALDALVVQSLPAAPVVNSSNVVVGVLSERDLLRPVVSGLHHRIPIGAVDGYMTTPPITFETTFSLVRAARIFLDKSIRGGPVVEKGILRGWLTRSRVLSELHSIWTRQTRMADWGEIGRSRQRSETTENVHRPVGPLLNQKWAENQSAK